MPSVVVSSLLVDCHEGFVDGIANDMARLAVERAGTLYESYDPRGVDKATGLPEKSEYARLGMTAIAGELESIWGVVLSE